jgi:methionyl aminopeptidase
MISVKNFEEIKTMRQAGRILAEVMQKIARQVKPGVSTLELDQFAEKLILSQGVQPAFKGYGDKKNRFPATLCTSVNEQVVHAIPQSQVILKKGDIIGLDCGLKYQGYYSDMAITLGVGEISPAQEKLLEVTKKALQKGIAQAKTGNHLEDISWAIQSWVEKNGFSVVRQLTGHGIGKKLHEQPSVFNFGQPGQGPKLKTGMTLAIEPMVNVGDWPVATLDDGWTIVTEDNSLSAHFENTILITPQGGEVLSKV